MKRCVAILSCAVLVGLADVAVAAQLLSPPLPTSEGSSGACYVRNTGTTALTVEVSVFSNNGIVAADYRDFCSGTLPAGHTCVVLVDRLPDDSYAGCRATAGTVAKLRGTLEIRETSPTLRVLVSEDLR